MKSPLKMTIILTILAASLIGLDARASETACYGYRSQNAAMTAPSNKMVPLDVQTRVWCYKKVSAPRPATLIYNADQPELRPELAVLVESGSVTHASLLKGKTTINKLAGRFNPLGVPLTPPGGAKVMPEKTDERFLKSVDKVLDYLMTGKSANYSLRMLEGDISATAITSQHLPWRGFWWSFAGGKLHAGPESPLAKYDRYVAARTGQPSLAQIWESVKHAPDGNPWSGHCNGWAASSIMRPEPTAPITDPVTGITFSIGDQKGILASQDNCMTAAFFGERYNGWRGETMDDIYPGDFHNVLLYYIGQLRKPIAMDRFRNASVDNHVASGFDMKIKREGDHFDVTVVLNMHKYDAGPDKAPGPAPMYTKEFKYRLWLGGKGDVIKAQWLTENNPDFIWVPLAPLDGCEHENPYVQGQWINQLMGYGS
ncbi:MAG: hypothetical protein V4760_04720 [Bdellovibrionota bacterium]